jgi:alanyl-tRNA synthetase
MVSHSKRLYYDNSYLTQFEALVVAHGTVGGRAAVALDRSAFYPEGGGQPADTGTLDDVVVIDVQNEGDEDWHVLADQANLAMLPLGMTVNGTLDWPRRLDHMQQHHGQHLLTAAFIATSGFATTSFHLSANSVTIDLATAILRDSDVEAAEDLANNLIWEDRPVVAHFVEPAQLALIPLRKAPRVAGPVRVVSVPDFDYSVCGGTHPRSTGSVGQIVVQRWAKQKNGVRVEFACGGRALRAYRHLNRIGQQSAAFLNIGVDELKPAIERLRTANEALYKELATARESNQVYLARELARTAEPIGSLRIVVVVHNGSMEELRSLAQALLVQNIDVALVGGHLERAQLVVACTASSEVDARSILAAGLTLIAGRGGGSTRLAQGSGPAQEQIDAALAAMRATLVV